MELSLAALVELCRTVGPEIILLGARRLDATSARGWRVAWASGAADCLRVELEAASRRLTATRPVYGGMCWPRPVSRDATDCALRPKAYAPLTPDRRVKGK